jgi:hypothetical protein
MIILTTCFNPPPRSLYVERHLPEKVLCYSVYWNIKIHYLQYQCKKVMYCYGVWQKLFEDKEKELALDFHEGLPTEEEVIHFADGSHNVIVIDDLMDQVVDSPQIQNLFTRLSHHKFVSVIFVNQNMFCQGRCARNISLNTHYMFLLRNPRDLMQFNILARQTGMKNTLIEAYRDCISKPYGYLLVDLSPHSDENYSLKTNIFPEEDTIVYLPTQNI